MDITGYDPEIAPDPVAWLALDETIRIGWVADYHRGAAHEADRPGAHAALHVTVENQIAMELTYVADACTRLMAEGLSRHDALHAIAAVLTAYMSELVEGNAVPALALARYQANCERMTAESWLSWLEEDGA
jgi:hypothetical protein